MTYVPNYSRRRVYWATRETIDEWLAAGTNSAGDFDIATDGELVCGEAVRGETLIWSTTDVWSARYIGAPLYYSFDRVGRNCGIVGPQAKAVVDAGAFWMSQGQFFRYDGAVHPVPCDVADKVFGELYQPRIDRVFALVNAKFNEVTWFYPTDASGANNHYVSYNYLEGHWNYGTLARSAGVAKWDGVGLNPVLIDNAGGVFDHETGNLRLGKTAFLESGPLQLGDGDNVAQVQTIVPDDKTAGDVQATIEAKFYPDDLAVTSATATLTTSPASVRITGRQFKLRLTEAAVNAWRVGVIRLGAVLGGRR